MASQLFPLNGTTVTLSATTSAPTPTAITPTAGGTVRVYNSGSSVVFVRSGIGDSDGTATSSHTPIAPSTVEAFSIPVNHNRISAIVISGGANTSVYVTFGDGE